jgi:hypothetical protein
MSNNSIKIDRPRGRQLMLRAWQIKMGEIIRNRDWPDGEKGPFETKSKIIKTIPSDLISNLKKHRGIPGEQAGEKYFDWLNGRAECFKNRQEDKKRFGSKAWIRSWIHRSICQTQGKCYYSGRALDWSQIGVKQKDQIFAPSIDHDREGGSLEYRLTFIRLNRSKQDMDLREWYLLVDEVKNHQKSNRTQVL